jgi:hypothetical protein
LPFVEDVVSTLPSLQVGLYRSFRLRIVAASAGVLLFACGDDGSSGAGGREAGAQPQVTGERDAGSTQPSGGSQNDAGSSSAQGGGMQGGGGTATSDAGGASGTTDGGGSAERDGGGSASGDGGGGAERDGGGSASGDGGGDGSKERFSFFMASQAGMIKLSGNKDGFGGDLRFGKADGLSGADEICKQLAETSMPGNGKTWRAFLSVTKGPDGAPVHAIDRIGEGPWYDRRGRPFAMNKAALRSPRPVGCDPVIINDFPNEDGVPNHDPGTGIIDNHNTLTGSNTMGMLDSRGLTATCQDWTSKEANGGKPRCGVSWPRASLTHWISILDEGGCAPGATQPGKESGAAGTVGFLGGYGAIYCFALTP